MGISWSIILKFLHILSRDHRGVVFLKKEILIFWGWGWDWILLPMLLRQKNQAWLKIESKNLGILAKKKIKHALVKTNEQPLNIMDTVISKSRNISSMDVESLTSGSRMPANFGLLTLYNGILTTKWGKRSLSFSGGREKITKEPLCLHKSQSVSRNEKELFWLCPNMNVATSKCIYKRGKNDKSG